MEEFQRIPRFTRKIALYSSTKFGILKPWTIISKLIKIDLGFWETSKQIHRRLKYKQKVLEEFQRLPYFPRKMVLYSSTKFGILKLWTIIFKLIRFNLGFWETSKQIYRRLKYKERVLQEFQRLPRFPRKMVLESSRKGGILKLWTIISNLIRFDWVFWETTK